MRKYGAVAILAAKVRLVFRTDVLVEMLFTAAKAVFAVIVWGTLLSDGQTVAGFTLPTMLTYYIVSTFFQELQFTDHTGEELSQSIRQGTFSKYMLLPIMPQGYFLSRTLGKALLYAVFAGLAGGVSALVFGVPLAFQVTIPQVIAALAMQILGMTVLAQFSYCVGLLAFKYLDVSALLMVKGNLTAFATGAIIPLALLPGGAVTVLRALPFYYVTYLPSMVMIGRGADELAGGFVVLLLWMALLSVLSSLWYKRLRRRYDGVGV